MLINGDFENGFREVDGIGELKVANDWQPWWHQSDRRPEFKLATLAVDPHRVRNGQAAQQWFTSFSTHTGGIYQQVHNLTPGKVLQFTASVQAFSRNDDSNWRQSDGRYRMKIGIDPYGGVDPECKDIVWSQAVQPYDAWTELFVEAVARSDRCTVWVWGQCEWGVKHNNGYVDGCMLRQVGEDVPPPPGEPGDYVTASQAHTIAMGEANAACARLKDSLRDILASVVGQL